MQSQATQQQANDNAANVTRIAAIGTAEATEAGGLGAAQTTLAAAAGTVETGLVGELTDNDNSLAGEEATADEGFYTALGTDAGNLLTDMAQADVDWGGTKVSGCAGASRRRVANERVARGKT